MKHQYIGIMTGTSMDGIDIALAEFDSDDLNYIRIIASGEYFFSDELKEYMLNIDNHSKSTLKEISQLNIRYSFEVAKATNTFLGEHNINSSNVTAIGFHGQTLWHQPNQELFLNEQINSTYQLGSGAYLAAKTNINVVSDFRSADIALGGQGAPLVPIFDFYFLKEDSDVVLVNIGGIANITFIAKNSTADEIIAFDTGPGNCIMDSVVKKHYNLEYDKDGKIARSGKLNRELLDNLMDEKFIQSPYPKSTGKEEFNLDLVEKYSGFDLSAEDLLCTLTHFTAKSIAQNIEKLGVHKYKLKISGGGAKNKYLMELIAKYTSAVETSKVELDGREITDSREALLMAFLAFLRKEKLPANIPTVTGAKRKAILGAYYCK